MQENLLALLEKSRLFSPYSVLGPKPKINIDGLKDYKFFVCNCFSGESRYFEAEIKNLLRRYIEKWAEMLDEDPEKKFDWKLYSQNVFNFFASFGWDIFYEAVKSGKDHADLIIKANGSIVRIKRFGDILAFNILNDNNRDKEHRTGINAIKALCRAEDSGNNQGVYELIHKVQVSIPVLEKNSGGYIINFNQIIELLQLALPWVEWNFIPKLLIERYLLNFHKDVIVGKYFGFNIYAELVHEEEARGSYDLSIWRNGNIENIQDEEYQFKSGDDLKLKLELRSSIPDCFLADPDINAKYHNEQFRIAEIAAIFCAQLCSMELNRHREIRSSVGY